jgi:hypothetical protein
MVRASRLLKVMPYIVSILIVSIFLIGLEISSETASLADYQQQYYTYPIDVQVFWLQGRACVLLPPDNYIANCSYVTLIPLMLALTALMVIVLVVYALLRKRVKPLPVTRKRRSPRD